MRRLLGLCLLSVVLYLVLFGLVLERPLSLGPLHAALVQKTARLARLGSPKLVIIAGSNGPFSHDCAVIGPMLEMPCENAGVAVGIGLDDIFARDEAFLQRGDIVYLPLELQQYTASAAQYRAGVDGAFLLRQDRVVLARLPPGRVLGAMFCCTLEDLLDALVEMPLSLAPGLNPAARLARQYDVQGDRIDNPLAGADRTLLSAPARVAPDAEEIEDGYGTRLVKQFVARMRARGVRVIGGLPVDFQEAVIPPATIAAVQAVYGGDFLLLANHSQYPRADFFNGEDHLAQPCQILHSISVANGLGAKRGPRADQIEAAHICPFAAF